MKDMIAASEESTSRSTLMRKIGGYGAAIAVTPYLLIKIAWTFRMFLPNESMGDPNWRAINATTAVLALVGILLAMAFSRPWGERLPAWLVIPPLWVGTGLLVPMVLLAPVLGPAAVERDKAAGATAP
jgi:prepilin signal peptidase PulO-like enzyme (type II secretory pathway)